MLKTLRKGNTHLFFRYRQKRLLEWGKFFIGVLALTALALFFGSGYTPPGILGDVIRHNRQADIDASPFFYGDVENMTEIIETVEQMRGDRLLHSVIDSTQN